MKYQVHRLDIRAKTAQEELDRFLETLRGEVVSIVPIVVPAFRPMGATAITSQLLVVEKVM